MILVYRTGLQLRSLRPFVKRTNYCQFGQTGFSSVEVYFVQAAPDLSWPIVTVSRSLLRAGLSETAFLAMIGTPFRSATVPAIYADFGALAIPGLRDAGIEATLSRLPDEQELRPGLTRLDRIPIYEFAGEPFEEEVEHDDALQESAENASEGAEPKPAEKDRARQLARSGLLSELTDCQVTWDDQDGRVHSEWTTNVRARFTRILELNLCGKRATRRVAVVAAVRRAMIFALAYPDRFLTDAPADAGQRELAGRFLIDAAGKQRDTISRRWRQAGEAVRAGQVSAALELLYDSVLRSINLPRSLYQSLSQPDDEPLTDLQLRDLVYLARAGTVDFKVLAAHRMSAERSRSGVSGTLRQLERYPDPLVRAAATERDPRLDIAGEF
jgi:hypothetical protein